MPAPEPAEPTRETAVPPPESPSTLPVDPAATQGFVFDRPAAGPGTLPPGYEVVDWLGRGQFGTVYRVRGPGGFESALKVIRLAPGAGDGLREFRSLRLIRAFRRHPNLIEYHGVWLALPDGRLLDRLDTAEHLPPAAGDSRLLILMQLAERSLDDRLRECPDGLPADELLHYLHGAARGLDHLHTPVHDLGGGTLARVVHRDVKPANLLLSGGDAKLADYGVARAQVGGDQATQSVACTPGYAPPEVYANKPGPASDQYSLAVTYYQLRTGVLPFAGDAMRAHFRGELDFGRVAAAEQAVLRRATATEPGDRYPSCLAFVEAMRTAVEQAPTLTGPQPTPQPSGLVRVADVPVTGTARRTARRWVIGGLAVLVAAGAGLLVAFWPGSERSRSAPGGDPPVGPPPGGPGEVPVAPMPRLVEKPFAALLGSARSLLLKKQPNKAVEAIKVLDDLLALNPPEDIRRLAADLKAEWLNALAQLLNRQPTAHERQHLKDLADGRVLLRPTLSDEDIRTLRAFYKEQYDNLPPAPEVQKTMAQARALFGAAVVGGIAYPDRLAEGLSALERVLAADPPDGTRLEAEALRGGWGRARIDLDLQMPAPADRLRFEDLANNPIPGGLTGPDAQALRTVYAHLNARFPLVPPKVGVTTPAVRLETLSAMQVKLRTEVRADTLTALAADLDRLIKSSDEADRATLTRFAPRLLDPELVGVLERAPAGIRKDAGEKLYAPVARTLFALRPSLMVPPKRVPDSPATVAAGLAEQAARLTGDPNLKGLAGLFQLEAGGWTEEAKFKGWQKDAEEWVATGSKPGPAALAYLGELLYYQAAFHPDHAEKIRLYLRADQTLRQARAAAARTEDEDSLGPVVTRDLAVGNITLANVLGWLDVEDMAGKLREHNHPAAVLLEGRKVLGLQEVVLAVANQDADELRRLKPTDPRALDVLGSVLKDRAWLANAWGTSTLTPQERLQYYRLAEEAFKKATEPNKGTAAMVRTHALLHLGRCRFKWAADFQGIPLLADAEADLTDVVKTGEEADQAEAMFWLARVELLRAGITSRYDLKGAPANRPAGAAESLGRAETRLAELVKLPANSATDPWRIQALEWQAELACARADRAARDKDPDREKVRQEARAALDRLKVLNPISAALLRARFLTAQLKTAEEKGAAPPELEELWKALAAIGLTFPTPRLQDEIALVELYAALYQARAIPFREFDAPAEPSATVLLDRLCQFGKPGRLSKMYPIAALGRLGNAVAEQALTAGSLKRRLALLAGNAFLAIYKIDPTLSFTDRFNTQPTLATNWANYAQWQAFLADTVMNSISLIDFKPNPDRHLDNVLSAYDLYEMAISIYDKLPDGAKAGALRKQKEAWDGQEKLIRKEWLIAFLPQGIAAVEKDQPAKAKAWQARLMVLKAKP